MTRLKKDRKSFFDMIKNYDYEKHNDEYLNLVNGGKQPGRVLMALSANPRIMLSDPNNNPDRIIFENYMNDYSLMADISCRFQEYSSNQLFCDKIMGFENTDGFTMWYDSQNTEEHRYFGGDIVYHGFDVPSTVKLLNDNNKYAFIDKPFPAIDTGPYAYGHEYYMYCLDLQKNGFAWKGKPIKSVIDSCELGTDGPLTICCCLLGAGEICAALYEEEAFALDLLNYIADATIYRIKEGKKRIGQPEKAAACGLLTIVSHCFPLMTISGLFSRCINVFLVSLRPVKGFIRSICAETRPGIIR